MDYLVLTESNLVELVEALDMYQGYREVEATAIETYHRNALRKKLENMLDSVRSRHGIFRIDPSPELGMDALRHDADRKLNQAVEFFEQKFKETEQ